MRDWILGKESQSILKKRIKGNKVIDDLEGWSGRLGLADVSFYIYIMDKKQGPTVQHREPYPISYDKP